MVKQPRGQSCGLPPRAATSAPSPSPRARTPGRRAAGGGPACGPTWRAVTSAPPPRLRAWRRRRRAARGGPACGPPPRAAPGDRPPSPRAGTRGRRAAGGGRACGPPPRAATPDRRTRPRLRTRGPPAGGPGGSCGATAAPRRACLPSCSPKPRGPIRRGASTLSTSTRTTWCPGPRWGAGARGAAGPGVRRTRRPAGTAPGTGPPVGGTQAGGEHSRSLRGAPMIGTGQSGT